MQADNDLQVQTGNIVPVLVKHSCYEQTSIRSNYKMEDLHSTTIGLNVYVETKTLQDGFAKVMYYLP